MAVDGLEGVLFHTGLLHFAGHEKGDEEREMEKGNIIQHFAVESQFFLFSLFISALASG